MSEEINELEHWKKRAEKAERMLTTAMTGGVEELKNMSPEDIAGFVADLTQSIGVCILLINEDSIRLCCSAPAEGEEDPGGVTSLLTEVGEIISGLISKNHAKNREVHVAGDGTITDRMASDSTDN